MNYQTIAFVLAASGMVLVGIVFQAMSERRKKRFGRASATIVGRHASDKPGEVVLLVETRYQGDPITVSIAAKANQRGTNTGDSVPVRYLLSGRQLQEVYLDMDGDNCVAALEALSLGSFALAVVGYSTAIMPYLI